MGEIVTQEQILVPLRELYRRDINHRKSIALYANNFKQRGVFLRLEKDQEMKELNFERRRICPQWNYLFQPRPLSSAENFHFQQTNV